MGFNDRLAELQGDTPSWAQEDTGGGGTSGGGGDTGAVDIEMGATKTNKKKQKKTAAEAASSTNLAWAMDDDNDTAGAGGGGSSNNNDTAVGDGGQPEHMKQFFQEVEDIKSDISAVTSATEQIISLKDRAVLATSETEESQISETIKTLVTTTNGRAKKCKNLLGLLKEENSNMKKETDETKKIKQADLRIRENLVNTLLRKFIDEMKRYQNSQQQYKTDV
ncbi:MAG: hypothetical protein GY874_17530, partial [Desulfobacteraceae bacterium]|nr:hypothetical protein [Desulfobacteraceae bacterium]